MDSRANESAGESEVCVLCQSDEAVNPDVQTLGRTAGFGAQETLRVINTVVGTFGHNTQCTMRENISTNITIQSARTKAMQDNPTGARGNEMVSMKEFNV